MTSRCTLQDIGGIFHGKLVKCALTTVAAQGGLEMHERLEGVTLRRELHWTIHHTIF